MSQWPYAVLIIGATLPLQNSGGYPCNKLVPSRGGKVVAKPLDSFACKSLLFYVFAFICHFKSLI